MEMTYDWIVFSSEEFKKEIRKAVASNENTESVWQNRFRISFDPPTKYAYVRPYSPTSEFHYKIIPTKFSYNAVMKLLEKDFDNLTSSDIIRLDD